MREIVYNSNKILLDEGVFFGQGVFETILWLDNPIFLEEHIKRLKEGLRIIDQSPLEEEKLLKFLRSLSVKNCALKILVTPKNIIITEREIPYTIEDFTRGITLKLSGLRRNSTSRMSKIKWSGYIENIIEKKEAKIDGYDDAFFLNEKGRVTETSCSNIFLIKDGTILTPKIEDGLLDGIIRRWIIDNFVVIEKSITLKELYDSDEVFITNSLMGVMKVVKIDDKLFEKCILTNVIRNKLGGVIYNGR